MSWLRFPYLREGSILEAFSQGLNVVQSVEGTFYGLARASKRDNSRHGLAHRHGLHAYRYALTWRSWTLSKSILGIRLAIFGVAGS